VRVRGGARVVAAVPGGLLVEDRDDADTVGAVFGQIAGAYYGESEIPKEWRSKLALVDKITEYADQLMELSASQCSGSIAKAGGARAKGS
jgi:hypothetical protein